MVIYFARRLFSIAFILVAISIIVFLIVNVMPGDVAQFIAGQFASADVVDAIRTRLGLDRPLPLQYWSWVWAFLSGNFGDSLVMQRPIGPILAEAFGRSAMLAAISFVFVAVFGILFGVVAALNHNRPLDHIVSVFTYLGISVPEFFWGIVLILFFAGYLHILPSGGYAPLAQGFGSWLSHLVLPAATLTFTLIAHISRLTRSSMLEVLSTNYVRNARAKGMPKRIVVFRHALRNALLPTVTVLAIDIGWLLGGIVVIESVFSFPGIGRLLLFAIERHDIPLIQASVLLITATYCLANLAADLVYAYLNPKIRYA
jgi:peptide/nickel transport system permease protein